MLVRNLFRIWIFTITIHTVFISYAPLSYKWNSLFNEYSEQIIQDSILCDINILNNKEEYINCQDVDSYQTTEEHLNYDAERKKKNMKEKTITSDSWKNYSDQNDIGMNETLSQEKTNDTVYKTVTGTTFVVSNAASEGTVHQLDTEPTLVCSANNGANVITSTKRSSVNGLSFYNMTNNHVRIAGQSTSKGVINRFWADGSFSASLAKKEVYMVSNGDPIIFSMAVVFKKHEKCTTVDASVYTDNEEEGGITPLSTVSIDAGPDANSGIATKIINIEAGHNLYVAVKSRGEESRVIDADVYVFLSNNPDDEINLMYDNILPLYDTDTIVISDGKISLEYLSRPLPDGIGNSFDVCEYNVGHFAQGDLTPVGDDLLYEKFTNTFQQVSNSILMLCEWDENWNESGSVTSETMFGPLRPYWSSLNARDGYILQRVASQNRIVFEHIHYFDNYFKETGKKLYFLDCVMNSESGDNVHFIVTHLTWRDKEIRKKQIREIIDYIKDNEITYFVVAGDFNNGCNGVEPPESWNEFRQIVKDDIRQWTDEGYLSAQNGQFGNEDYESWMHTYSNKSSVRLIKPYDDIIISNRMGFIECKTISSEESDHKALFATISIGE